MNFQSASGRYTTRLRISLLVLSLSACTQNEPQPTVATVGGQDTSNLILFPSNDLRRPVKANPLGYSNPIKQLLTGGSSKTWMLDNSVDAPFVVGVESDPTRYFPGVKAGELPACQADDEYTFSTSNVLIYNAKAETYSAAPVYTCTAPQTGISPMTFSLGTGAGRLQFKLQRPGAFIGTTDASPTEQLYRVISINPKHMVLRAGSGRDGDIVFTFKMIAK
jgi:hypothetical protein